MISHQFAPFFAPNTPSIAVAPSTPIVPLLPSRCSHAFHGCIAVATSIAIVLAMSIAVINVALSLHLQ
jgi:hypothetical protein